MEKTIRVTILGREYPLRVSEAHEDFTRRVAEFVDERIRSVEQQAPGHPDLTHAVVAAMSLAEELMTLQDTPPRPSPGDEEGGGSGLEAEAEALADRLEAVLAAGTPPPPEPGPPPRSTFPPPPWRCGVRSPGRKGGREGRGASTNPKNPPGTPLPPAHRLSPLARSPAVARGSSAAHTTGL